MLKYFLNKLAALLTLYGVITVIFFLFNVLPVTLPEWCWTKWKFEQLAIIKKKYGFDKPISPSTYTINDLSPISIHSNNESDYSFWGRENTMQHRYLILDTLLLYQDTIWESFQKAAKRYPKLGNTLPNSYIGPFAIIMLIVFGIIFGIISALHKTLGSIG
jgi:peptide/nickel transport system permease protein